MDSLTILHWFGMALSIAWAAAIAHIALQTLAQDRRRNKKAP